MISQTLMLLCAIHTGPDALKCRRELVKCIDRTYAKRLPILFEESQKCIEKLGVDKKLWSDLDYLRCMSITDAAALQERSTETCAKKMGLL